MPRCGRRDRSLFDVLVLLPALILAASGCAGWGHGRRAADDLPAFRQVDDGLYRGGQPTPDGIRRLAGMGVKTIVCLRHPSATIARERRLVGSLGMRWVNLPMWFWWRPSEEQVRQFLAITSDPSSRPVFVHCQQGRNRAGILVAVYRVVQQHWTPEEAYAEARRYGLVWWNPMSRHLLFREMQELQPLSDEMDGSASTLEAGQSR